MQVSPLVALGAVFALGCQPTLPTAPALLGRPLLPGAGDEAALCRAAASQDKPLVTEWPASEKANLEAQLGLGGVAVVYSGCKLRVLSQCVARGRYRWQRTTPARDAIEIKNKDELYAKLPLGAASLSGELESSGKLVVETTVAGYSRLDAPHGAAFELEGQCAEATHVVSGVALGAFELHAGLDSKASAQASGFTAKAGGSRTSSGSLIRQAGTAELCREASDESPDPGCASPIQLFLAPAAAAPGAFGAPSVVAARDPALDAPTELPIEVRSADPDVRWDVVVDGTAACQTPCSQTISPRSVIGLKERRSIFSRSSKVTLDNLRDWSTVGGVRIEAHDAPLWNMSGLLRLGGIFYSAIGAGFLIPCLTDAGGDGDRYCSVGGITLGIGIPLFAVGTWVMDAPGSVQTSPLR